MRILQINNYSYRKGGAETVFINLISLLKQKGHEVFSFSRKINGFESENIDFLIPESKSLLQKFYSTDSKQKIKSILQTIEPDVIHVHNIVGGITFSILPEIKKLDIPVIGTIHDFRLLCPVHVMINGKGEICEECKVGKYYKCVLNHCHPDGLLKSTIVAFESYLRDFFFHHKRYFDAYLFVSQFTKSKFLEFYPDVSDRAHVIYNFSSDFDSSINRGDYVLYIGRLDREKGLPTLLKAFREMKDIKLVIAGSGPLKELINQYNINDNIVYVGYKRGEELSLLIKNSEYVIVPSECYENLPMSVVESFSYSKPVISSKLGGLKELVENSSAGFLFEPKNVNDLMRVVRIAKSISDDEYKILSNNAYQFAINNFNSENFYAKLLAIYKKLITSK